MRRKVVTHLPYASNADDPAVVDAFWRRGWVAQPGHYWAATPRQLAYKRKWRERHGTGEEQNPQPGA